MTVSLANKPADRLFGIRNILNVDVTLSGDTTMFHGTGKTHNEELTALAPVTVRNKVVAPPEEFVVWFLFLSVFS